MSVPLHGLLPGREGRRWKGDSHCGLHFMGFWGLSGRGGRRIMFEGSN